VPANATKRTRAFQRVSTQANVIGKRLAKARKEKGWSQEKLSSEIEAQRGMILEQSIIAKIEGFTRSANDYEVQAFALVLEVSADWLLGIETKSK
jgi:transcriptional regulator with XRE-family HTH domain